MKTVWITRPELDAQSLIDDLGSLHFKDSSGEFQNLKCISEPLLNVVYQSPPQYLTGSDEGVAFDYDLTHSHHLRDCHSQTLSHSDGQGLQEKVRVAGLIVTSRNGLRGFCSDAGHELYKDLPLFAVGPSTAETARSLGFRDVRTGAGRAQDLVSLIQTSEISSDLDTQHSHSAFLHLRGDEIAFSLKDALVRHKICVVELLCYRVSEAEILSSSLITQLKNYTIGSVVLMSPRTARAYYQVMKANDLLEPLREMNHFCLSEAVYTTLRDCISSDHLQLEGGQFFVASEPSQERLLECFMAEMKNYV